MALADLSRRRLVIVTGKGGVGKTTVAASMARAWARNGQRVLCAEITAHEDTPSALAELLGGPRPTDEPVFSGNNIWTVLLTPSAGHKAFLQDTLPLKLLADAAMKSAGLRRFLMAAPGFADMGVMYRMLDLMKRKHHDGSFLFERCVIDSPATGHALALAQIPELLIRVIPGGPIVRAAKEGLATLTDPNNCAALIVTLPETLPVTESLELKAGLLRHKVPVAGVLVNRVPANPFSPDERAALDKAISNGTQVFGGRELKRISRSDAALALLEEQVGEGARSLPELDLRGGALADALATKLLYMTP